MDAVHPRYQGLKDTVKDSEVLASQYAAETMKVSDVVDKEEFEQTMKDWDKLLLKEGLTVSNANIGVFSEVTLMCEETGQKELSGKFALAIISALHQIARQYMTSSDLLERLDGISDQLYQEVDKLAKQNEVLSKIIPKKKIIAARRRRSVVQDTDAPMTEEPIGEQSKLSGPYIIVADKGGNTMVSGTTKENIASVVEAGKMETEDQIEQTEDTEGEDKSNMDPLSEVAKRARDGFRAYYGDPKFAVLSPETQVAIMEYYITHILGVVGEVWEKDPAKYHMLMDLTDKNRVLSICEAAKKGEVTPSMQAESIEEIAHAINACHTAYGNYGAITIKTGEINKLHIS